MRNERWKCPTSGSAGSTGECPHVVHGQGWHCVEPNWHVLSPGRAKCSPQHRPCSTGIRHGWQNVKYGNCRILDSWRVLVLCDTVQCIQWDRCGQYMAWHRVSTDCNSSCGCKATWSPQISSTATVAGGTSPSQQLQELEWVMFRYLEVLCSSIFGDTDKCGTWPDRCSPLTATVGTGREELEGRSR